MIKDDSILFLMFQKNIGFAVKRRHIWSWVQQPYQNMWKQLSLFHKLTVKLFFGLVIDCNILCLSMLYFVNLDPHQIQIQSGSGSAYASICRSQAKTYGIRAYLSTFLRVWAFIWKLGFGSESASGWKVGSGSASNKKKNPDTHQGDKSSPDPHQCDADPQYWLSKVI